MASARFPLLPRRRWCGVLSLAMTAALVPSCRSDDATVLPPEPPIVHVAMSEMRFEHPDVLPRGRVVFEIRNVGTVEHRLVLVPIPEGSPPIAEQVSGEEARVITPLAGIPNHPPGDRATLAVDLDAGRYSLLCLIVDPDGKSHALKGMASEFEVHGKPPPAGIGE